MRVGGLTGLNTDSWIRQIMDTQREGAIKPIEDKKTALETKQKAWRQITSTLSDLKGKLDPLRLYSTFQARKATVGDTTVADVTANAGAPVGSHTLTVSRLAKSQGVASAQFASATSALGLSGNIQVNGKTIALVAADSLNSIRDKLNKTGEVNVNAVVQNVPQPDGTAQYRLNLTATNTGIVNKIRFVDTNGTASTGNNAPTPVTAGTGALGTLGLIDNAGNYLTEVTAASDASFTLDGLTYTRANNVVSDILSGVTLTLKKENAPGDFTIAQDVDKVVGQIKDFSSTYNSVMAKIDELSKYDSVNKKAMSLAGDYLVRQVKNGLKSLVTQTVPGLPQGAAATLTEIGVTGGAWNTADFGKLKVDETKLRDKLTNDMTGVARLFGAIRENYALAVNGATASATSTATTGGTFAAADVIDGSMESSLFGTSGGGWQSAASPSTTTPQELTVSFGGTKNIEELSVYMPNSATSLKDFAVDYQKADGTWANLTTVTGNADGRKTLTFTPVSAQAIRIKATATNGDGPASIMEVEVMQTSQGIGTSLFRRVDSWLQNSTGAVSARDSSYNDMLKTMDGRIDKLNERLTAQETLLTQRFQQMELAVNRMKSIGGAMSSQMGYMAAMG